jgi:hypothetical protein
VRLLADRLTTTARRLSALAATLARLRDGAMWDGPAGDAFGARLHDVVPVLDAVAVRLGGAGPPLRALAEAMEEAQAVTSRAVLDVDEAEHAYAVLEERVVALLAAGTEEGSAEVLVVRHLQTEQVRREGDARARHAVAADRFREADQRCAAVLRTLSVDGIADSLPYRVVAGLGSAGHDLATVGPLGAVVPELRPVAAAADAMAVAADATLLAAYGEGDLRELAQGAALAAAGALGGVARAGATAGAHRTAAGVVVTARLTPQQRLALGAVRSARARRDAVVASFRVPPERGSPSALLGGPPPRTVAAAAGGADLAVASAPARLAAGARMAGSRARVLARARVERAFLDDWRLATANGPAAQRMYVAGATLEVTSRTGGVVADRVGPQESDQARPAR